MLVATHQLYLGILFPPLELASFIKYFIGLVLIVYILTKAILGIHEQADNEIRYLNEPKNSTPILFIPTNLLVNQNV